VSESWNFIFNEMLHGSLNTIFNLLKVLIPLMIVIELLIVYNVLEKISTRLEFLGKPMGITKNAMFPLLVGVFMGVTYGAGTLIELNKRKPLGKRDFLLIGIFMVLCHGII
jgi:Nucleoside recognition